MKMKIVWFVSGHKSYEALLMRLQASECYEWEFV